jgi:hypothetical protein
MMRDKVRMNSLTSLSLKPLVAQADWQCLDLGLDSSWRL